MDRFPADARPDNVGLLYYSYHLMVGLGHDLPRADGGWRCCGSRAGSCVTARPLLWALVLAVPLPYIANTAGWMTAEIGRQPWLVYGLMRTAVGTSPRVSAGNGLFSLLGFMGLYALLSIAFIVIVSRIIAKGFDTPAAAHGSRWTWARSPQQRTRRSEEEIAMVTFWFLLVAIMLVAYVVLDGFDLGVGAISKWVAHTQEDRALVRRSIGPVWDANEVWLLAAGGALYFAFPQLYASSFSGFYLPLMMVLWLLIGRALGLELRGHAADHLFAEACDAIFMISSLLLPVFFGAALGNVDPGRSPRRGRHVLPAPVDQLPPGPRARACSTGTRSCAASSCWSRWRRTARTTWRCAFRAA